MTPDFTSGRPVAGPSVRGWPLSSVVGRVVQADLLTSDGNMNSAGALRSTGVTPLPRYYGPLRLPTRPDGGYGFPSPVDPRSHPDSRSPGRVSQVPRLIFRRPPSRITPGRPDRCICSLLRGRCQASPVSGRLATPHWCNEAEGFACATADVFAFPGSDGTGYPGRRRVGFMVNEQLPWSVPFN